MYSWSLETPPPPIPEGAISETITSDIVIVGAGIGGLPAAMKAAEMGATVQVLEKGPTFGEPRGGYVALDSKVMRSSGVKIDRDAAIIDMMAISTCINVQQANIVAYVDNSPEFADWLIDIHAAAGIPTTLPTTKMGKMGYWAWYPVMHVPGPHFTTPPQVNWTAPMYQYAKDKGAVFHFNTPGKQLIKDKNGRITGVIAQKENGDYVKFTAKKAVILATGDFGRNPEMVSKYYPDGNKTFWNYCNKYNTGDGHKMGMWAGGLMDSMAGGSIFHGQTITGKDNYTEGSINKGWPYSPSIGKLPMLYVDIAGNRCMNEDLGIFNTPAAILQQPGAYVWSVWDSTWKSKIPPLPPFEVGANNDDQTALDVEKGITLKANTIDELIKKMGVSASNFKATLKRYNELCVSGKDTDFLKGAHWMKPVDTPPFYAAGIGTGLCATFGGLKVGPDAHVLDKDGLSIPGLYAVGAAASFYGPLYICNFGPSACGHSMIFGYLAAKKAIATGS
jgi:fumarate reductase flavoprotein subunit